MRIRPTTLLLLVSPLVLPVVVAYLQWATVGLPVPLPPPPPDMATAQGFPTWLRVTHYVNFLFIILLIRSGLQILMDHPRLYWNVHCTPGTEWLRQGSALVEPSRGDVVVDDAAVAGQVKEVAGQWRGDAMVVEDPVLLPWIE